MACLVLATRLEDLSIFRRMADQSTGSSAENDQMNHLAKGRHNDTVAILPPPHPWSSSLQGGTLKISDPAQKSRCNDLQNGNMLIALRARISSSPLVDKKSLALDGSDGAAGFA